VILLLSHSSDAPLILQGRDAQAGQRKTETLAREATRPTLTIKLDALAVGKAQRAVVIEHLL